MSVNWDREAEFPEPGTPSVLAVDSTALSEPQGQPWKMASGTSKPGQAQTSFTATGGQVYGVAGARPMPGFIVMTPWTMR